jgi:hypothetical protein
LSTLVVLDGELAVPCDPKSAHAGLKVLVEDAALVLPLVAFHERVDLTLQTVTNPVRSGRKQR